MSIFQRNTHALARGFTLIEMMLVLGGITFLTSGALIFAKMSSTKQDSIEAVNGAHHLAENLMQTFGASGDYSKVQGGDLVGMMPQSGGSFQSSGSTLSFKNWGPLTVSSRDNGASFALSFTGVPVDNCAALATQLPGAGFTAEVEGTPVSNPVAAATLCGGADSTRKVVSIVSPDVRDPNASQFGEQTLGPDAGKPAPLPPQDPTPLKIWNNGAVAPVTAPIQAAENYSSSASQAPAVSASASPTGAPVPVPVLAGGTQSNPPNVALPPPTCVAGSVTGASTVTTESGSQTLSCPSPQTGAITQSGTRTHTVTPTTTTTCPSGAYGSPSISTSSSEVVSGWTWVTTSNTCTNPPPPPPTPPTAPPVPQISFAFWGSYVTLQPSYGATSYQVVLSCKEIGTSGAPFSVPASAFVTWTPKTGDTLPPPLIESGISFSSMPASACVGGLGNVNVAIAACNGSSCSSYSAPITAYCSFNHC